MTTSASLLLPGFETMESTGSTQSRPGSPAKTSRSPARVTVWRVSDPASGERFAALLASFDLGACSWRMSGLYEGEDSLPFSETLPRSVSMRRRTLYLLPALVQITSETASSSSRRLLPTLQAEDFRNCADYSDGSRGHSPQLRHLGKGRLCPSFCETFMGFPPGWTECE